MNKNIDWDSIYNVYSSQITANTTEKEVSELIGEMTLELKDVHVRFSSPFHSYKYSGAGLYDENPPYNATGYIENISINSDYIIFGEIKNRNYAYLRIKNFTGNSSEYSSALQKLEDLGNKEGLVIDIRSNAGGSESIAWEFAGRLSNVDRLYRYSRYRNGPEWNDFTEWYTRAFESKTSNAFNKDIILLTNRYVYSSAELFALMMKTIPNVTSVGDTTFGATANPEDHYYGNNDWVCRISRWQIKTLDSYLLDDHGIPPDVYIKMTESSIEEGKDLILEKAIELLD